MTRSEYHFLETFLRPRGIQFSMFFHEASFGRPECHLSAQGWEKGPEDDAKMILERPFPRKVRFMKMLVSL